MLQHLSSAPIGVHAKPGVTWDYLFHPVHGAIAMLKWLVFGKGPLATLATPFAAFIRSDDPK